MPEDLRQAYETFTLLCTHYNVTFAGLGIRIDPMGIYAFGNVTERGHDLAELFRKFAEIIEERHVAGRIKDLETPTNKIN